MVSLHVGLLWFDLLSVLALLCVIQVMHPSTALSYVTVWSRKYSVTGAIGLY